MKKTIKRILGVLLITIGVTIAGFLFYHACVGNLLALPAVFVMTCILMASTSVLIWSFDLTDY